MKKCRLRPAVRRDALAVVLACATSFLLAQKPAATGDAAAAAQLREAMLAGQRGDVNRALDLTRTVETQHPKFAPAFKFEGALLDGLGHGPEAAAAFEKALLLAPKDAELLLQLGIDDLVAGNKEQAITLLTRRLELVPADGDTLYYLAQAYHLQGDNKLALKTIQACVKVDPDNPSVWQKYGELLCSSGNNAEALEWLTKAQHADPTLDRIDFDLGVASYNNQDLEAAGQYATKAVAQHPNDFRALALLASVDSKLGRWQDAAPVFQQILAIKSDDPASLLGLGHCLLELKQFQPAADTLERLVQQDPTQVQAHFYLSRAYLGLHRTADAEHEADLHSKMMERAASFAASREDEAEKATLKQARQLLVDGHEPEAVHLLAQRTKGAFATPGAPYMLVGAVYLYMGRQEDAQRCLNKALQIEPGVHDAHTYLGILALQGADLEKADTEFKVEIAGEPNDQLAVAELGEVRYRQGRWSEAADQLAKSRTVEPALLYMLCDSYFHLGKVKEADLTAELIADYGKGDHEMLAGVVDLLNRNQQAELAQRLSAKAAHKG